MQVCLFGGGFNFVLLFLIVPNTPINTQIHYKTTMSALAPITGTLKKRIITDIVIGFSLGGVMASYWWWGFHKNVIDRREAFYADLAEKKKAEN